MAVKTNFTSLDFKKILSQYDIGAYVRFTPFEQGTDQTNLLLTTTQRQVVLRYYEKRTLDYATFEIELLHHLAQHSYPCAVPFINRKDGYVSTYKKKPLALFELLPGEHNDHPDNYLQVAEAIGNLHVLTAGYRPGGGLTRPTYNQEYCWLWAQKSAKSISQNADAKNRLAWMRAELDLLQLPGSLPKGTCHGDLNPTNFLYEQGKLTGVLDFDQASYTWLLYDLGQLIYWWTWPDTGDMQYDQSRKLVEQYEKRRRMTHDERLHLFDALKLVILIGIGWFLDDDEGYMNARRKIESLNTIGRDGFYNNIFGRASDVSTVSLGKE